MKLMNTVDAEQVVLFQKLLSPALHIESWALNFQLVYFPPWHVYLSVFLFTQLMCGALFLRGNISRENITGLLLMLPAD